MADTQVKVQQLNKQCAVVHWHKLTLTVLCYFDVFNLPKRVHFKDMQIQQI